MQRPVGYDMVDGRAELTSIGALLGNEFALHAYLHVILVGLTTGSMLVFGVACWHFAQGRNLEVFRKAAMLALLVAVPISALNLAVGSRLGIIATTYQPMKIAASEALWETEDPAAFSLFQIGGFTQDDQTPSFDIAGSGAALVPRDGVVQRRGHGPEPDPVRSTSASTGRNVDYMPSRAHRLLGDADDGVPRDARLPRRRRRRVPLPQAAARDDPLVQLDRRRGDRVPVHRGALGLGADRDGAPAVDRAGAA